MAPKYDGLLNNIIYLALDAYDVECLNKFKDILVSKHRIAEHDAIIRVLKSSEHIDERVAEMNLRSSGIKMLTNGWPSAEVLREFETTYRLSLLNSGESVADDDVEVDYCFSGWSSKHLASNEPNHLIEKSPSICS